MEPAISELVRRLVANYQPEQILLFGSRAAGTARPDSDWDILVVLPDEAPEGLLDLEAAWQLTRGLGVPIDVMPCYRREFEHDLQHPNTISRRAAEAGVVLYAA